jgi:hypothetical protein
MFRMDYMGALRLNGFALKHSQSVRDVEPE